jgi:hypothetical protein
MAAFLGSRLQKLRLSGRHVGMDLFLEVYNVHQNRNTDRDNDRRKDGPNLSILLAHRFDELLLSHSLFVVSIAVENGPHAVVQENERCLWREYTTFSWKLVVSLNSPVVRVN